jgi:hypothetical protein
MKSFVVVEDYDSGPEIASLNIRGIFLSEEKAYEKRDKLLKDYDYVCDEEYHKTDEYQRYRNMFRVEEWEVEE